MAQTLKEARKEFLGDCRFIASAPGAYFWAGEHAVMYGQLAVLHVIPLYAYIGIERTAKKKFEFELRCIKKETNIELEKLTNADMEPIKQWYEEPRIEKYLEFWRKKKKQDYFKAKIWFQIPPKCGLNSSGAISTAIASLLQVLEAEDGKRESVIQKINAWQNESIAKLKEETTFNAIFRKAWILEDCFHNFSSSGMGPFSSLVGSRNGDLLLFFTQKKGFDSSHPANRLKKDAADLIPEDFEGVEEKIRKIDWWGKRLPLEDNMKECIGTALIYCGEPKDTGGILAELEKKYDVPVENYKTLFFELFSGKRSKEFSHVARSISDFLRDYDTSLLDTTFYAKSVFCESLGLLSWMLVRSIKRNNLSEIAAHINTINKFLNFYGVFRGKLVELYEAIKEINGDVGIKLTGAGGGGDLVVLGDRDAIEGIEESIKREYAVHFSTNRMGWQAEGLTILKPHTERAEVIKTEKEEIPSVPRTPLVSLREHGQIEIEFTSTGVKIDKRPEKPFTAEWRMLEYFLWKNDRVHWTEGYLIYPKWSKLLNGATDGQTQFTGKRTKCRQNAEKDGLKIEFKKKRDADAVWWELVTYNISTNITKAAPSYEEAEDFFDAGNWNEAWEKLLETLKIYPNHLQSHLLLVRCYDKLPLEKRTDVDLQQLQSFWCYLNNKRIITDGIRRICSKKKKDNELQVFLLSLLNHPPYSQLDELTELLWSHIVKMNLTKDEIEIMKINRLLRDIRTAKNNAQQEEKINAFCRIPCVAKILTDEEFREASGLLFFSRESNDLIESRFQTFVTCSYKTTNHLERFLRKTLRQLNKDLEKLERPARFSQFADYEKFDSDIKRIDKIEEKLRQKLHKERITDEELTEAAENQTRWSITYIKWLIECKNKKLHRGVLDDDKIDEHKEENGGPIY